MYYNHQLRSNLQEQKNQLSRSAIRDFKDNFRFFFQKIYNENILKSLLDNILDQFPLTQEELDFWRNQFSHNQVKYKEEYHRLSYYIHLCNYALNQDNSPTDCIRIGGAKPSDSQQYFLDRIITPIVNYLHESLDEVNTLLYILEKYKLRTEWFTKDTLKEKYKNASTKQYEQVLEDDIRLFLFDQGIDYPFSTPKSASGRADIVSLVNTEDPLVMEIKIYDSEKGYKKDRIISGFTQIVKYANDYHKSIGYLVVFNLDNVEIEIENQENDKHWPNRIIYNGKTYYVIIINLNYDISASKQKTLKNIRLEITELTGEN